jgi:two-component system, NtrC family, sensor kinase
MENARLITETREALEQQTAAAEVLRIINASPGDLAPVFDAILEKAYAVCDAAGGDFVTFDGEFFRSVAMRGMTERFGEMVPQQPYRLHPDHPVYTLVRGEQPFVHAADLVVDWAALLAVDPMSRAAAEEGGVRTVLMVPLRKENTPWYYNRPTSRGAAVFGEADHIVAKFRGTGGHRDGECAAAD